MFTSSKSSYNVEYQRYGYNIVLFDKNSYKIEASKAVKIQNIKINYEPVYKEK